MKHEPALIGQPIHVYRQEWNKPEQPRAGIIAGYGADPGLFSVTVFHDPNIDLRQHRPLIGFQTQLLVVADREDVPVGVFEYGVLAPHVSRSEAHLAEDLVDVKGDPEKAIAEPPSPEALASPAPSRDNGVSAAVPPRPQPVRKGGKCVVCEDAPKIDGGELCVTCQAEQDRLIAQRDQKRAEKAANGPPPEDEDQPAVPAVGGQHPIEVYVGQFEGKIKQAGDADRPVTVERMAENELVILIGGDDKPAGKVLWTFPAEEPGEIRTTPWGMSFRLRDKGGRCSIRLADHVQDRGSVATATKLLIEALACYAGADPSDYASAVANAEPVLARARERFPVQ